MALSSLLQISRSPKQCSSVENSVRLSWQNLPCQILASILRPLSLSASVSILPLSLQLWCVPTTKGSADATLFPPTWINSALCAGTLSFYDRNFFQAIEGIDVSNTFTCYRDRKARALLFSSRKHLTPCLENTVKRYTNIAPTFTRTPTNT